MNQFPKPLLALLALVFAFSSCAFAQDNLPGKWKVKSESPEGENNYVWEFTRTGDSVAGSSTNDGTDAVTEFENVKLAGDELSFSVPFQAQGQEILLKIEAELAGESLKGEWFAFDTNENQLATGALEGKKVTPKKSKGVTEEQEVLFDGSTLDNFRGYKKQEIGKGWKVDGETLHFDGSGGGDIITKKDYGSFELTFDWKISEGGNSGVMYRVALGDKAPKESGIEYQILDNDKHADGKNRKTSAAAIYALYPPGDKNPNPVGQWNTSKIVVDANRVQHWLNGDMVAEAEIGSDAWNEKVAGSKFATWEKFAQSERGHISFQDHRDQVWYRNIKIKALD